MGMINHWSLIKIFEMWTLVGLYKRVINHLIADKKSLKFWLVYIREQPTCAVPAFHQTSARDRDPEKMWKSFQEKGFCPTLWSPSRRRIFSFISICFWVLSHSTRWMGNLYRSHYFVIIIIIVTAILKRSTYPSYSIFWMQAQFLSLARFSIYLSSLEFRSDRS